MESLEPKACKTIRSISTLLSWKADNDCEYETFANNDPYISTTSKIKLLVLVSTHNIRSLQKCSETLALNNYWVFR